MDLWFLWFFLFLNGFFGLHTEKNCGFFCPFFLCSFGSKKQVFYTKTLFWQKDLNFEASGENAILGELTINWTFTFLHKSFGSQRKDSWSGEGRGGGGDHKVM